MMDWMSGGKKTTRKAERRVIVAAAVIVKHHCETANLQKPLYRWIYYMKRESCLASTLTEKFAFAGWSL